MESKDRDEMIKQLRRLVTFPSVAGGPEAGYPYGKAVGEALEYVLALCDSFGFETKNCGGQTGWAQIGHGHEMIGILCHLDVVPAGTGWTWPPFEGTVHDGKIYGRGVMDDKGPAMACIFAMKRLLDSGICLDRRIRLIFGQNEESGDWTDMEYYKAHEEMPVCGFTPDADFPVIYGEKGIAILRLSMDLSVSGLLDGLGGAAPNMVADKAFAVIKNGQRFEAKGRAAHGSTPEEGDNAVTKVMEAIRESSASCLFADFYMTCIGHALHGENFGCALEDCQSGSLTMNVGMFKVQDGEVSLMVDVRYPVTFALEDVLEPLRKKAGAFHVQVEVCEHMPPVYMDQNSRLIQTLMDVYETMTMDPTPASTMGGGTYARAMEHIVAFGPVFPGRECTEHKADEYIFLEDLEKMSDIYFEAMKRLAIGD